MYTQCPECQIAFRVTARVLQQAGGKVRCGGCGNAFSALEHLSEEMPGLPADAASNADTTDELAETSKRLLKTLDELAGPEDVRIEDTGVEWRVLDEAEAAVEEQNLRDTSDTGSIKFDADENIPDLSVDSITADRNSGQNEVQVERRYDDNTPLPDDFDDEDDLEYIPQPVPQRRESDFTEDSSAFDELQGDLALSEPGEWTDLLDEVSDPDAIPPEVADELEEITNQIAARDDLDQSDSIPDSDAAIEDAANHELPVDIDSQFEMQAEALGITGSQEILEQSDWLSPQEAFQLFAVGV